MLIPVEKVTLNACSECVDGGNVFIAYAIGLYIRGDLFLKRFFTD